MLEKLFTKNNILVNVILTAVFFLVWIIFLGHPPLMALLSSVFFLAILFFFDWLLLLFKGTE